ncbi:hypothetical protein BDQ17DRAFT_1433314 [Cyathus striatus]|nr:hypothetical protein BDQ17DRAFT_1433314 [Cyathus striatus]
MLFLADLVRHKHVLGTCVLPNVPFLQQQQQFLRHPLSAFDSSAYNPYTFRFRRPSDQHRQSTGNLPLFPSGFGSPPPYSTSPFGTMNDLVAPLSQSISPLQAGQYIR